MTDGRTYITRLGREITDTAFVTGLGAEGEVKAHMETESHKSWIRQANMSK